MRKISEIRSSKSEIRNKLKIRLQKYLTLGRRVFLFGRFAFSSFVSDFELRDSDFPAQFLVPAPPG